MTYQYTLTVCVVVDDDFDPEDSEGVRRGIRECVAADDFQVDAIQNLDELEDLKKH